MIWNPVIRYVTRTYKHYGLKYTIVFDIIYPINGPLCAMSTNCLAEKSGVQIFATIFADFRDYTALLKCVPRYSWCQFTGFLRNVEICMRDKFDQVIPHPVYFRISSLFIFPHFILISQLVLFVNQTKEIKIADSVLLSLFMRDNEKCNNSHAP